MGGGTKWNPLGSKTGPSEVQSLPSGFNELLVVIKINNDNGFAYSINIPNDTSVLSTNSITYRCGTRTTEISIKATTSGVRLDTASSSGTDYSSTSTITVYYR